MHLPLTEGASAVVDHANGRSDPTLGTWLADAHAATIEQMAADPGARIGALVLPDRPAGFGGAVRISIPAAQDAA